MNRHLDAVRRAATVIDVPGTPRTLRLDSVDVEQDTLRLRWSFLDPNEFRGDPKPPVRRVRGETVAARGRNKAEAGRAAWAEAQLAAAYRYKLQIDADWLPGEPYVRRVWTVEDAWQALLDHLAAYGGEVRVLGGEITVTESRGTGTSTYLIDPAEWADFISPAGAAPEPPATPTSCRRGLPRCTGCRSGRSTSSTRPWARGDPWSGW